MPCETDFKSPSDGCIVPWEGPYTLTLTSNNFNPPLSCDPSCSFTFTYYDRFITCHVLIYDVQIVGINSFGGSGCYECFLNNKTQIIRDFLKIKFNEHNDFFEEEWGDCMDWNHRVTLGACYLNNNGIYVPCSNEYCCATWLRVCYDEDGNVTVMEDVNETLYFGSSNPIYDCSTSPMNCPGGEIMCDLNLNGCPVPCDKCAWDTDEITLPFWNETCPECHFKVNYSYRACECDGIIYKDYRINEIDYSEWAQACNNCLYWDPQQLFQYALDHLFNYGPLEQPDIGECEDHWRFISAACWKDIWNRITKCDMEYCCRKTYRVCNYGGDIEYTLLHDDSYINDCSQWDPDCYAICGDFPYRKSIGEKIKSNKNDFRILFDNKSFVISVSALETANGYYKFEVYNISGIKVYNNEFKFENEFNHKQIDISNLRTGVYFLKISKDNIIHKTDKIVIVK